MTWQEITMPDDIGGDELAVNEIRSGKREEYYLEKEYIGKSGRRIPVALYVHRFPPHGDLESFIVSAEDISEKRDFDKVKKSVDDLVDRIERLESKPIWYQNLMPFLLKYWPIIASIGAGLATIVGWALAYLLE